MNDKKTYRFDLSRPGVYDAQFLVFTSGRQQTSVAVPRERVDQVWVTRDDTDRFRSRTIPNHSLKPQSRTTP